MAAAMSLCFGFVLVLLMAPSYLLNIYGVPAADFRQWCGRTTHNSTCFTAIESDPRKHLKTTPNGFCTILNNAAVKTIEVASEIIDSLMADPETSDAMYRALQNCSDAYYGAMFSLINQNFTVLDNGTYPELNIQCSRVFGSAFDCETYFKPPLESPLSKEDQGLSIFAVTIAEILNLSQCNQSSTCRPEMFDLDR